VTTGSIYRSQQISGSVADRLGYGVSPHLLSLPFRAASVFTCVSISKSFSLSTAEISDT
jgi:hypothetical protein